ncbi:hypothetical protein D3C72_1136000 [compost metagenome]
MFRRQVADHQRAAAVDHFIGQHGRQDGVGQRMVERRTGFHQQRWEVRLEHRLGPRFAGQRQGGQDTLEAVLHVGDHHRQFRRGQATTVALAACQFGHRRQLLEIARQRALFFQAGDQGGIAILHGAFALRLQLAHQQMRLLRVVAQDQALDVVRHRIQLAVAFFFRQLARVDFHVQPDFHVHFMVRAIHAGRVVDRIGEDAAAGQRELDTARLRRTEIAAFGHDFYAQLIAADADVVIRAVLHLRVALRRRLDVGADAAVVEQVHGRLQDTVHQFFRRQ